MDDGTSDKQKWTGYYRNYIRRADIMIPLEMESTWNLIGGKFSFAKLIVTEFRAFSRIGRTSMSTRR